MINIESTDYWLKTVGFLQNNWAVIEKIDTSYKVYFFGDTSGVFDQLDFNSADEAKVALLRNRFVRYEDDKESQGFISKPRGRLYKKDHPNGAIYSSGRYWVDV